jgi:hypothetical protein
MAHFSLLPIQDLGNKVLIKNEGGFSIADGGIVTQTKFAMSFILALLIFVIWPRAALSAPIDDLIAGAKEESVLELYAPSTLTPEGAQRWAKRSIKIQSQY